MILYAAPRQRRGEGGGPAPKDAGEIGGEGDAVALEDEKPQLDVEAPQ